MIVQRDKQIDDENLELITNVKPTNDSPTALYQFHHLTLNVSLFLRLGIDSFGVFPIIDLIQSSTMTGMKVRL